jgi:primosomal protein N' (replication factor Y)
VDHALVAEHPAPTPITVGSERDLAGLAAMDLVVLVDIDGLLFGVDYRAAEEAFRIGVRLASAVRPGSGHRLLVQTSSPEHPVIAALRRADPGAFWTPELQARRSMGYPPFGALIVIEARGDAPERADSDIQSLANDPSIAVLGPAPSDRGLRWLIQGDDLRQAKSKLRTIIQRMRDSGLTVRVDVDPIDL